MAEYIERDKAIEKINAYCELRQAICINDKDEFLRGLQTALKAISYNDVIPNADVQPIRRGRWIIVDDVEHFIAVCSVCGRTEDSRCIDDMPYCHCGARMDGDTE